MTFFSSLLKSACAAWVAILYPSFGQRRREAPSVTPAYCARGSAAIGANPERGRAGAAKRRGVVRIASGRGGVGRRLRLERKLNQLGDRVRAGLFHHPRAVRFHGLYADRERVGDRLVG